MSILRGELSEHAKFLHSHRARGRARQSGYDTLQDLVLAEGTEYVGSKKWFPGCGWRLAVAKQCYRNAHKLMMKNPARFTYCEGWVLSGTGNVVEHAWVEDQDGLVIDPTMSDGLEYMGLRFRLKFACETIVQQGLYGLLCGYGDVVRQLLSDPEFRSKNLVPNGEPAAKGRSDGAFRANIVQTSQQNTMI